MAMRGDLLRRPPIMVAGLRLIVRLRPAPQPGAARLAGATAVVAYAGRQVRRPRVATRPEVVVGGRGTTAHDRCPEGRRVAVVDVSGTRVLVRPWS